MKKLVMTMAALVAVNANAGIEDYCADKWGNNYEMQRYCQNQQFAALNKLRPAFDRYETEPGYKESAHGRVLYMCLDKWSLPRFETVNFEMANYCVSRQIEAYLELSN